MGGENSILWPTVRRELGLHGVLYRIENSIAVGTPDLAYVLRRNPLLPTSPAFSGWMELKFLSEWPKRWSTRITIPHLTLEQVMFVENWVKAGGDAFCLLQVANEYFLLRDSHMRALYEGILDRHSLDHHCAVHATGTFPKKGVLFCLAPK